MRLASFERDFWQRRSGEESLSAGDLLRLTLDLLKAASVKELHLEDSCRVRFSDVHRIRRFDNQFRHTHVSRQCRYE
jgi:hypothetical protein